MRHKALRGGRGSGKSHATAEYALIRGTEQPGYRCLCGREYQTSIKQSVKQLLADKIVALGMQDKYQVLETEIRGPDGGFFNFAGLRTNIDSVKSAEGYHTFWGEEAQRISQNSIDVVRPTLRSNSEMIWTWNPYNETDPVDAMFRQGEPPPRSVSWEVNWQQNPKFPDELREELEWDKARDLDKYLWVWEGNYQRQSETRVFNNWRIEDFETPEDVDRFYFGADFGFAVDPAALIRCFISGRTLYLDFEAVKVGCEVDHTPALFAGDCPEYVPEPQQWENPKEYEGVPGAYDWPITGDSARPEIISYMRRRGFDVRKSIKGKGSIYEGVKFLKSFDIVVHPRCIQAIKELTYYSYKVDPHTNEILPVLEDDNNHIIDALRYALETYRKALVGQLPPLGVGGDKQENWAAVGAR